LKPIDIVESYEAAGTGLSHGTLDQLWDAFGAQTAEVMFQGARTLAMVWDSAWVQGGGEQIAASKLKRKKEEDVRGRYIHKQFVESLTLEEIGAVLKGA
jgi:hypothetical protein